MQKFKRNALTIALLTSGLMSMSATAVAAEKAQAVVDDEIEVIEITGIRRSLAESQAVKMTESSIVEAISAEDIGKLPDVSIAESIARLPGVTAQRLNGRANVVSIRGLAPDFTTTTLNGREQVTIGDNRGVELDQYPSELINGVVVYKTPDAGLMSQAIGGTIDMKTIRPLSHGKRTFSFGFKAEENDLGSLNAGSEDKGERFSFSYIDQFLDDTLGVAIGVASMSSPNQEERWQAWGYPAVEGWMGKPGLEDLVDTGTAVMGGAKPYVRSSELERDGVMAVVEWQPNDKLNMTFDGYYSDFKDTQILRGIELPGAWGGGLVEDIIPITVEDGLVTEATFVGVTPIVRNDINKRDAELYSLGLNTNYQLTDKTSINADIAYSKADRKDWGLESYSGLGRVGDGIRDDITYKLDSNGKAIFTPGVDYSDPSKITLGATTDWGNSDYVGASDAQDGYINTPEIEDELFSFRLSATHEFDEGFISSVEGGVNYTNREKTKNDMGVYLKLVDYPNRITVPEEYMLAPTSLDFIGMGDMLSYDSWGMYKDGFYEEIEDTGDMGRAKSSWQVEEKVWTLYSQANVDTEIFDMSLKGNFGVQVVNTDQSSDGKRLVQEGTKIINNPVTISEDYTEVLPSVNLGLEVIEDHVVRFAAARTLARARMDQMNANFDVSYDPGNADSEDIDKSPWSGGGGNPELRPTIAWQYDLSYETYFDDFGYASLAGYYKDLEDFVFNQQIIADFTGIEVPDPQPILREGYISGPANGEGGHISGIEATVSLNAGIIDPMFSGFGAILTGSITESEIKETSDSPKIALPGLSKKVLNATVYYEDHGFQARVSSRYRSDFLGEVSGLSMAREFDFVDAELVVDAQIGYDFSQAGFEDLEGLSVMFQVSNLTDEPFSTYRNGDTRQKRDYQVYGRNFMLGMNYSF